VLRRSIALPISRQCERPRAYARRLALCEGQALKKAGAAPNKLSREAKEKFPSAIESFRRAFSHDPGDGHVARQATYLIGLCLLEQGDMPAALKQMERTAEVFRGPRNLWWPCSIKAKSPAAWAAIPRRCRPTCGCYRLFPARRIPQSLDQSDEAEESVPGRVPGVSQGGRLQNGRAAQQIAGAAASQAGSLELTARIYRTWGDNLLEQAEHLAPDKAEEMRKQARTQLRAPATASSHSPRTIYDPPVYRTTLEQRQRLLCRPRLPQCGHHAAALCPQRVPLRHAQALVDQGECELSLGQTDLALKSFQACIEQHPRDAAIYRAGFWPAGPRRVWAT